MPTNRLQMDDLQAIADAATAGFGIAAAVLAGA